MPLCCLVLAWSAGLCHADKRGPLSGSLRWAKKWTVAVAGDEERERCVRRGIRQVRMPGQPRLTRHVVKVNDDQERRLVLRAVERRISVARLLVEAALAGGSDVAKAKAELAGELYRVSRLLGKVGVNINQMAKITNATGQAQIGLQGALGAIERVCGRIHALLLDVEGK